MKKQLVNSALTIFSSFDKWDAFLDLSELKNEVQKSWVDKTRLQLREIFRTDDLWRLEFGSWWWDVKWHFISASSIKVYFWLCQYGNFHFVIQNENNPKAELIKEVFGRPKFDAIRYIWGSDL